MHDIRQYIGRQNGIFHKLWTLLISRGLWSVVIYRMRTALLQNGRWHYWPVRGLFKAISFFFKQISIVFTKSEICPRTEIKQGLFLSNKGNIIIGANRIGSGCVIQENVTIGKNLYSSGKATLGDNVWIGANCIISGGIKIGSGSTIREGSVLTKSIPENCVVQGNPARVIEKGFDNSMLLSNPLVSFNSIYGSSMKGDGYV